MISVDKKISSLRSCAARLLFRLAYWSAPKNYHRSVFCLPGEHIGRALVKDGGYESSLIDAVRAFMRSKVRAPTRVHFIDIGANIGTHTVGFSDVCVSSISFEPNPVVAAVLRVNISLNHVVNAEVRELALSSAVQRKYLSVPSANQGNASVEFAQLGEDRHELVTSTLDRELIGKFPTSDVLLIKVDVEGHEFEVIQGAKSTLESYNSIVVVEYNKNAKSEQLIKFFADAGYSPSFQIDIPRMNRHPIYRALSLLGLKKEAIVGPFKSEESYLPAVVFVRKEM
jgi:FkbM family methyltransferase